MNDDINWDKAQQEYDESNPDCPWIDDEDTYESKHERQQELEDEYADDHEDDWDF